MNAMMWLQIFSQIPMLVQTIEQASPNSNGQDKLAAVLSAISSAIPAEEMTPKVAQITAWINVLVSMYNTLGLFKKQG